MIDLEPISGLPISLTTDNRLRFRQPLPPVDPAARTYQEMRPLYLDQESKPPFEEMYYMYRNVHFAEHENILATQGVSYDITVIPAGKIGEELNKTAGHYHAVKPGTPFAYPEIYEVLHGRALFLLQKMDANYQDLITVIAMEARTGDKVVYPPNYGHIIVNIGQDTLVTSNWVASHFDRLYQQIEDRAGMAYYVLADQDKGYRFAPNQAYTGHPEIRMLTGKFMRNFALVSDKPMYLTGTSNPKSLEFLNHPDKYAVELSSITS